MIVSSFPCRPAGEAIGTDDTTAGLLVCLVLKSPAASKRLSLCRKRRCDGGGRRLEAKGGRYYWAAKSRSKVQGGKKVSMPSERSISRFFFVLLASPREEAVVLVPFALHLCCFAAAAAALLLCC